MKQVPASYPTNGLPCAIQVGFAGARDLFGPQATEEDRARWEAQLVPQLRVALEEMRVFLGAEPRHFLVGVSQIAIGGDMVFARACAQGPDPILHRVLLPQPLEEFLAAKGGQGPDFVSRTTISATGGAVTRDDVAAARAAIALPHVIEVQCVSMNGDRRARFTEANLAILGACDVVVGLRPLSTPGTPGAAGTRDLLVKAKQWGLPVMDLQVSIDGAGNVVLHKPVPLMSGEPLYALPGTHEIIKGVSWSVGPKPPATVLAMAIKTHVSRKAGDDRSSYDRAVVRILGTHVTATALAAFGLAVHGAGLPWMRFIVLALLAVEVALLVWGFVEHHAVAHKEQERQWASARLLAELMRSVLDGATQASVPLKYLVELSLPQDIMSLLRTLHVLHLRDLALQGPGPMAARQQAYQVERIDRQKDYFLVKARVHGDSFDRANRLFNVLTILAVAVVVVELGHGLVHVCDRSEEHGPGLVSLLGWLAVVLPVVAVALLSRSNAKDHKALWHTYSANLRYLDAQEDRIRKASTESEFNQLVTEVEEHLLAEITTWYSRRSYKGVA